MDNLYHQVPSTSTQKIFIQRDYSRGCGVRFQEEFPSTLQGRISKDVYDQFIVEINKIFERAEAMSARNCLESCCACITAYLIFLCMDTYYEKCVRQVDRLVEQYNKTQFLPRGVAFVSPSARGLRVIEIAIAVESSH